jgi:hypothetical protein
MTAGQDPDRIVNLSEYRAERQAALRRRTAPTPYILWYPGIGYLPVFPNASRMVSRAAVPAGSYRPGL